MLPVLYSLECGPWSDGIPWINLERIDLPATQRTRPEPGWKLVLVPLVLIDRLVAATSSTST
jgi:hypothetical protein